MIFDMTAPKLTVGIPTFNRAGWLAETIESVLVQPFTGLRVIVSDNASDDETPEVVRSFHDERIDYVRSDHNVGAIGNLNRLIGLADTEYLMLLPDDDVLYPGHLGAAVEVLERFPSVGLVHTAFDLIDRQSDVLRSIHPLRSRSPLTIERHDLALERMMVSNWPICFSSVVYRTKAIVDAGGIRREDGPFGDLQLWMRMALDWDFGYIAKPFAGFRVHPETASRSIGTQQGVTSDGRELILLHARTRFHRRMSFLDGAGLETRRTQRLRALAVLQLLIDSASLGLPLREATGRLANLVRTYPRLVLRPALWRLVIAQLGGRRTRSASSGPVPGTDASGDHDAHMRQSVERQRGTGRAPEPRSCRWGDRR